MQKNAKHVELTAKLADLLLEEYKIRLENHTISDTGMANLQKLLRDNGWVIEDEALESVRSKLTSMIDPKDLDDEDASVVGRIAV